MLPGLGSWRNATCGLSPPLLLWPLRSHGNLHPYLGTTATYLFLVQSNTFMASFLTGRQPDSPRLLAQLVTLLEPACG